MAILDILHYPDERLRIVARPVHEVTLQIRQLASDMLETMYAAPGIGLAATQVNAHVRLFVTDCSEDKTDPRVFINPEILETSGVEEMEEGCLSIPGVQDRVARPERVRLRAMNLDGEAFELDTDGLLAVCIQHETDHLNGKLFIDYLSPLKRQRIRKKLEKALKQRG